jgi:predicted nucleotidyltransferase
MNIYQRPLFRQAGGPIAPEMGPMMPPQGMPPAPMAAPQMMPPQGLDPRAAEAVGQVEQGAAMQAEQYGQNMMAGLDAAETPEEVINAMRGNQRPLEARYGELAELVGQEDAQRTPETVLALLQPVMMMTEQGAMDSGIGELMGQLTGNIDMMDESGAPTEMGQGVGSLMMAGVGQQPVANFSQGGAVQRFQVGGEASRLQELYSEMLPVYQGVMGGGEDQRDLTKAQIFFDIADRFGAFAAGIDPRTGERMQGSAAAQFGAAASGLGGQIGERLGAQDQQERALRVAALQGAAGEFSAERADERAAARAAAAAAAGEKDRALGSLFNILDAEGNVVQQGVPIATQGQYAKIIEENPGIRIVPFDASGEIGKQYQAVDSQGNVVASEFLPDRAAFNVFVAANPNTTIREAITPTPGEIGKQYEAVDSQGNVVASAFLADRTKFEAFVAANPNTTIREAVTPTPGEIGKQYEAVDSQGNVVASAFLADRTKFEAFVAANPNTTIREAVTPTPGEIGKQYEAVDSQGNVVASAFLADRTKFEAFVAANPNTTIREAVTPTPGEIGKQYEAVDSQGNVVAIELNLRRLSRQIPTQQFERPTPTPGEIGKQYEAVDSQGNVVASEFLPDRAAFNVFVAANPNTTIREAVTPEGPSTLVERQQIAVTDQRTLDNLERLSPEELSRFAANADAYIQEIVSPAGVSSRRSLPPNTQDAMRRAHAAGIDFPGIDPSLFGAPMRVEQVERIGLALLDTNNVDLGAATGLLSPFARTVNLIGEQVAEFVGGTGTVFTQTAQASSALNTLAAATRRFYIEGRTLAKEFEELLQEIPKYSGFASDAATRRALTQQRNLLEGNLRRVEDVLENPERYTNKDISEARQLKTYADQLLVTYDEFIKAYSRLDGGGGTVLSYDDIIKNYSLDDSR